MTPVRSPRLLAGLVTTLSFTALASEDADRKEVARLDTEYQAAVKRNDAEGMGRVLHERFILVLGNGKTFNRKELIDSARSSTRSRTRSRAPRPCGFTVIRPWSPRCSG
ncbi:MAG: nuclear transport factor 2 family protein [Myxococcaceae bacterium]|nr:MAG: nuclear transport factor 2 family protein [Myxococcaceae bacterium]